MTKRKQNKIRNSVTENRRSLRESIFNNDYRFIVYFARRDPRLFEAWFDANAGRLFTEANAPINRKPEMFLNTNLKDRESVPSPAPAAPVPQKAGGLRKWLIAGLLALALATGVGVGIGTKHFLDNKLADAGQPPASPQEIQQIQQEVPVGQHVPGKGIKFPDAPTAPAQPGIQPQVGQPKVGDHVRGRGLVFPSHPTAPRQP